MSVQLCTLAAVVKREPLRLEFPDTDWPEQLPFCHFAALPSTFFLAKHAELARDRWGGKYLPVAQVGK